MLPFIFKLVKWLKPWMPARASSSAGIVKLQVAAVYLKSIQSLRLLFLSAISTWACLALMTTGIILIHVGLFVFAPWSRETKMIVALVLGAIDLCIAWALFVRLASEQKWVEMFHARKMVEKIISQKSSAGDCS